MIVMFQTIGLVSRGGDHVGNQGNPRRVLRIDRIWWAAVKVGAIVAVSVLVAIATALAFL